MIVSILSELEKGVGSTRQTLFKTVWSDINGEGIDNPALHEKALLYAEKFFKELQEFVSKQPYNKLRNIFQTYLYYA